MPSCDREPIEAGQDFILAMPEACDRSTTGQEIVDDIRLQLIDINITDLSRKRFQDTRFCAETHAHGLLIGDILSGHFVQLHTRPPKSKSATCRSPAKSTLA